LLTHTIHLSGLIELPWRVILLWIEFIKVGGGGGVGVRAFQHL